MREELAARRLPAAVARTARSRTSTSVSRREALKPAAGLEVVVDRVRARRATRARLAQAHRDGVAARRRARVAAARRTGVELVAAAAGSAAPSCGAALEPPRAGPLLVRVAARRVPDVPRLRSHDRHRLGQGHPRSERASLAKGAIRPWRGKSTEWERGELDKLCERHGVPIDVAVGEAHARRSSSWCSRATAAGAAGKFPGVRGWFEWLETRTYKMHVRVLLARYRSYDPCAACGGKRLEQHGARRYRVGGLDLADWHALEVGEARRALDALDAHAPGRASSRAASS